MLLAKTQDVLGNPTHCRVFADCLMISAQGAEDRNESRCVAEPLAQVAGARIRLPGFRHPVPFRCEQSCPQDTLQVELPPPALGAVREVCQQVQPLSDLRD